MKYDEYTNFNDNYNVKRLWGELKEELELMDQHLLEFYSPIKNITAGQRARRLIRYSRKRMKEIQRLLILQEQDYKSDYSDD